MSNMIRFANAAQAILFECELSGQISDGYWENSRPHDHWKIMCSAKITHAFDGDVTGAVIGKNFRPMRKYNFNNKELIDIVGNRMIGIVKFYTAFPNVSFDNHWDFEFNESAQEIAVEVKSCSKQHEEYYRQKAARIMTTMGATTIDDLENMLKKVDEVKYDMKMLRKDLKAMSELVNA